MKDKIKDLSTAMMIVITVGAAVIAGAIVLVISRIRDAIKGRL
ncbi:MAG: hypothetical protein K0R00_40 [Herbinix sp.]|jgi:hypothetical protein|nr:hypothetical protein [Herbinix sp.]